MDIIHKDFEIKPSSLLTIFAFAVHLLAFFCLLVLLIPIVLKTILMFFVGISFYFILWTFALLKAPSSIVKVSLIDAKENEWQLLTQDKESLQGGLYTSSYITDYVMLLNFKLAERRGRARILIFKDAVSEDDWRQLRTITVNFLHV